MRRILISMAIVVSVLSAAGASARADHGRRFRAACACTASRADGLDALSASTGAIRITSRRISGLGQVLVTPSGKTLYVFVPDKHTKVTCLGECAEIWPPVFLAARQKPLAAGRVRQSLLGSDPDAPVGERVVTYDGWPLYTYITDTAPGLAKGQGTDLNGGLWYVLSPSGKVIRTAR